MLGFPAFRKHSLPVLDQILKFQRERKDGSAMALVSKKITKLSFLVRFFEVNHICFIIPMCFVSQLARAFPKILDSTKTESRESKEKFVQFVKKWADEYLTSDPAMPHWYPLICATLKVNFLV